MLFLLRRILLFVTTAVVIMFLGYILWSLVATDVSKITRGYSTIEVLPTKVGYVLFDEPNCRMLTGIFYRIAEKRDSLPIETQMIVLMEESKDFPQEVIAMQRRVVHYLYDFPKVDSMTHAKLFYKECMSKKQPRLIYLFNLI